MAGICPDRPRFLNSHGFEDVECTLSATTRRPLQSLPMMYEHVAFLPVGSTGSRASTTIAHSPTSHRTDHLSGEMDGIDLAREAKIRWPHLVVIL
jgi:hypothetical protein